ncbi:MAG: DUF1232 domain-containing protein [Alphaproteobacteria bacterium]|nr:DUF1232 domain-containing protein [Alphaproteobacteria bacterium]
MWQRLKAWARRIYKDVMVLYIAGKDSRTPRVAKWVAIGVAAYALSPIDLIPDFIPVIGYLDDVILVPLGIALAIRLLPADLIQDFRLAAETHAPVSAVQLGAWLVIFAWICAAAGVAWLLGR